MVTRIIGPKEADDRRSNVDAPPKSTRPGYHSQGEDDRSAHRDVAPRSDRTGHQSREIDDQNSQQHASSRSNRPINSPGRSGSDQGPLGPVHVVSGQTSGHGMSPGRTQRPSGQSLLVSGQLDSGHQSSLSGFSIGSTDFGSGTFDVRSTDFRSSFVSKWLSVARV
jgi:hypothetical protein